MTEDVKEITEGCMPCQASVGAVMLPPKKMRGTPDTVFQHCSVDYKGMVGGDFYLHVLIDHLSRCPVVQVVKSTRFTDLKP